MTKDDQDIFYKAFGSVVKNARLKAGYTYAMLSRECGEQNKTIRHIELGNRVSLHHLVWANQILKITYEDIIEYINTNHKELISGKEENIKKVDDLI